MICLVILLSPIAVSGQNQSAQREIDSKTLIADFRTRPPHMIIRGDTPMGPMIDIIREAVENLGYKIKWQFRPFEQSIEALKTGRTDIVPRIFLQKDREGYVSFIGPIGSETKRVQFLIETGDKRLENYEDLLHFTIAVKEKGSYFKRFQNDDRLEKVVAANELEQIRLFKAGKVDAVAFYEDVLVKEALKMLQISQYRIAPYGETEVIDLYYGLSKKSPFRQLADPLQQELDRMKEDGRIEDIYAAYDKDDAGFRITKTEKDYLNGKGPLKMCSAPGWPPIEWIDENGIHQGISADFIDLIAKRIGHEIQLLPTKTWNETINNIKMKKCDFVSAVTKTDERSNYMNFTEVYQELDVVIATRKEQLYIKNLDTLAGEKIGVIKGSVYQSIIKNKYSAVEIVSVEDMNQGLRLVQKGDIIGLVDNLISLAYAIQQSGFVDIKISGRVEDPIQLRIGIRKDDPMLHTILSRALDSISEQKRQEFARKWISVNIERAADYTLLWKILPIIVLIILGIVAWNRKLAAFNQTLIKAKNELEHSRLEAEKAKVEAQKADRAKSVFLANMSHELRTPLNAIIGFSELMTRDPSISNEQQKTLSTIVRSGEHLFSLINDVLVFSKIEAGQLELKQENFDLHRLLSDLEEMFRLRTGQKGLTLTLEKEKTVPRYIRSDQNKLRQILINLLDNAVKYTEFGSIMLRVAGSEGSEKKGLTLHFEIFDTGIGISEKEQHKIFDAFFQTDTQRFSRQGSGLGLSISQRFVNLIGGGTLKVKSRLGEGSSFSFILPVTLAGADEIDVCREPYRVIGLAGGQPLFRLLVVEDDDDNRNLLVKLLEIFGFDVKEALNGREAVEINEKWRPHLIWMDMRMPVMDGYEATRRIKELKNRDMPKIIALTASSFEENRRQILANGCDDFVRKPFREHEIFGMLSKHLQVKFIHENETKEIINTVSISGEEMQVAVETLPELLKDELKTVAETIDYAGALELLHRIERENESLAKALTEIIHEYRFDFLLELFDKKEKNNDIDSTG